MKTIKLKKNSQKHRDLVTRHGDKWVVIREDNIQAFHGDPAMLICPEGLFNDIDRRIHSRWVRLTDVETASS